MTLIVIFLPFGGLGAVVEAVSTAPGLAGLPVDAIARPFGPPFGGSWMSESLRKVMAASTTRISAAPSVQESSSRVFPWIWAALAPVRRRKRTSEYTSAPSTTTKMTTAMARTIS